MSKRVMDKNEIPKGYIVGLEREYPYKKISHLYQGTFSDIKGPMCHNGANRNSGEGFSIWRNQVGKDGICKTCIKRAKVGMNHIWYQDSEQETLLNS